jgi:hypothetical protein
MKNLSIFFEGVFSLQPLTSAVSMKVARDAAILPLNQRRPRQRRHMLHLV